MACAHAACVGFRSDRCSGCRLVVRFRSVAVSFGVGGRITAVVVVVAVGVVLRVHRRRRGAMVMTVSGRRHRRTEAVVVEAVGAGAVVVVDARRCRDDYPALGAWAVPVEVDGLEVFEGSEAVKLMVQFVVRHDGEGVPSVDAIQRDVNLDSLDATGIYSDIFFGVAVAVVRVEVEGDVTPIGVVADILHDGSYYQQDAHQDVLGFHSW